MEFQEVVDSRRMVRRYTDQPVPREVVDRAIRNATRAPNAGFSQGWEFVVLDTAADVRRFWMATSDDVHDPDRWLAGMMTAPVVVLPCSDSSAYLERYAEPDKDWSDRSEGSWAMPYWHLDTAMASLLILQTAVDAGLGGCFFGVPPLREQQVRSTFGLPGQVKPIGAITLGHPDPSRRTAGSPTRRPRRGLDNVLHRGGWQGPG